MNKKIRESLAASYEDRKKQQEFFRGLGREDVTIEEEPIPNKEYETFGDYYQRAFRDSFSYYRPSGRFSGRYPRNPYVSNGRWTCGNKYCPICFPKPEFYNENTIQGEVVQEWPEIEAQ